MKTNYFDIPVSLIMGILGFIAWSNAQSDYSLFLKTDTSEYWVDHNSIEILDDGHVRMKTYTNSLDDKRSYWTLNNYDCKNEMESWDSSASFAKLDMKGKPYSQFKEGEMIETGFKFRKDSPEYKLMQYACVGENL